MSLECLGGKGALIDRQECPSYLAGRFMLGRFLRRNAAVPTPLERIGCDARQCDAARIYRTVSNRFFSTSFCEMPPSLDWVSSIHFCSSAFFVERLTW